MILFYTFVGNAKGQAFAKYQIQSLNDQAGLGGELQVKSKLLLVVLKVVLMIDRTLWR